MDNTERNRGMQRGTEKLVLLIYTIYAAEISFSAVRSGSQSLVPFVMGVAAVCGWLLFLTEYKTYILRAIITTFLIQFAIMLYGINSVSYDRMLPTFFVMAILTALYGMADCMYITVGSIAIVTLDAMFFKTGITKDFTGFLHVAQQAVSVATFEIVAIFWVRKRQQSSVQTAQVIETLRKVEQSKDDFLANVSHEIRTPLNTIFGMCEIILQERDLKQVREEVYQIQNASRTLMSTVSDVLDFSELQSGEMMVEEEVYHLTSSVQDIVNMAVAQKAGKNLELIVNMDPNLPRTLFGDEKKIRRAVMNLINNAIKFTDSGYVGIQISGRRESYGINLIYTITDTGIGMNAENVEKLFTSFNQVDTRRNRQEGGVGLGLAISKMIAEKMGGVLTVRSKPGKGSSIRLIIPQKVLYDAPAVEFKDVEKIHALCYVNVERFAINAIRDAYQKNIFGMIDQTGIDCHFCSNLDELKRRFEREEHNYVFTTRAEYEEDQEYFDMLADKTQVVIILDRDQDHLITNQALARIYKPCYVLPLAAFCNQDQKSVEQDRRNSFVAPDAHILVVDDNQMNIRVIQELLSKYQIKVTQALSGTEALEKIETMDYDFVFMDHMMPEMDGVETAHRIRGKVGTYFQRVPIIALTANAVAGSREMFLKEGFSDFLEKPVEISVLDRVLRRNLPESKIVTRSIPMAKEGAVMRADTGVPKQGELTIGELDVKSALLYCGGEENYLFILGECCRNYQDTAAQLEEYFAAQDWKNYGIKVHALKSTMRSIGAETCADLAYVLEIASKQGQYDVILERHGELMLLYRETMLTVVSQPEVGADPAWITETRSDSGDAVEECGQFETLSGEMFKQHIREFESAMYSLDKPAMEQKLDQLDGCEYCGTPLRGKLEKVHRKVAQADYFSAGELLQQMMDQLSREGGAKT